jgi:hypothetical protein
MMSLSIIRKNLSDYESGGKAGEKSNLPNGERLLIHVNYERPPTEAASCASKNWLIGSVEPLVFISLLGKQLVTVGQMVPFDLYEWTLFFVCLGV